MTTPGNLTMTIVRQGLTTLLHVIGALALLASLDPTLTRLHAENYPLKPFSPNFRGCPPPNTSPKACRGGNKWITSGTDEGSCGLCGIKVFEFIPGTCFGETTGGVDTPICRECNVQPGSAQDRYQQVAAPLSEALVCMIGVLGTSGALWVAICAGSVGTMCIQGAVLELAVGACAIPYCFNNCFLTERDLGDPKKACSK
jgi:hypothetical protein